MIRTPLIHKIVLRRMKKTYFSNLSSIHGRNHYNIVIPFQEIARYSGQDFSIFGSLGKYTGPELHEIADYVDKHGRPVPTLWGINGERVYGVLIDPAEREALHRLVTEFRINAYSTRKATGIGILQVSSLFQVPVWRVHSQIPSQGSSNTSG